MVISLLLTACDGPSDLTNTIRGIQIVAIEPIPAEPGPFDRLTLRTWVADGLGRGVDVLVWVCTPVGGQCLEALPPNSTGLPLSTWTRVGQADVVFDSSNPWPIFAEIAGDDLQLPSAFFGGNLLVWSLACAPGVCPIIDQVAIDPKSGSEAWYTAATALANPDHWIDELPRGQVSLAVKAVAVDLGEPDGTVTIPPQLTEPGVSTEPNQPPTVRMLEDAERVTTFEVLDPDADPLLVRSFATAGGVVQQWAGDSAVTTMWEEPLVVDREPVRFVVAEDGRGGTGVWCSDPTTDPCQTPELTLGTEDAPIRPGDPLLLRPFNDTRYVVEIPVALRTRSVQHTVVAQLLVDGVEVAWFDDTFTGGNEGVCAVQSHVARAVLDRTYEDEQRCAVLGHLATLRVEVSGADGNTSSEVEVVLTGSDLLGCQGL